MNIYDLPALPLAEERTDILATISRARGGDAGGEVGACCETGAGTGTGACSGEAHLCHTNDVRIERIVSTGQVSGWYDQDETEFVALLEGTAVIEYDSGRRVEMHKGDTLLIQPRERHKVAYTSTAPPCIWLCVFY